MTIELETVLAILTTVLVINLALFPLVSRIYKDRIKAVVSEKPSLESLDLNYQLKDHTPKI